MRVVLVQTIIDKMIDRKYNTFLHGLYDGVCMTDLDKMYKNHYVRKWMDLEQSFRKRGVDVRTNVLKDAYPRGLAVNLSMVKEHIGLKKL